MLVGRQGKTVRMRSSRFCAQLGTDTRSPGPLPVGSANHPRAIAPSRPQRRSAPRSAKALALAEERQAAHETRNEGSRGVGGDGTTPAEAIPCETDGGVRLAGGRLRSPLERGDEQHGGSSDVGSVPPPPYAEY